MNVDPNFKKSELCWCHLVGGVQRDLAAGDAFVFTNPGLYETVENLARVTRSFDFKYCGGSFFPLSFDSNSGLGYNFGAILDGCRGGGWWRAFGSPAVFKTYVEQKQQAFRTYYATSAIDSQLHNSIK